MKVLRRVAALALAACACGPVNDGSESGASGGVTGTPGAGSPTVMGDDGAQNNNTGGGSTCAVDGGICFNGGTCCGAVCCATSEQCCSGRCVQVTVNMPLCPSP